MLGRDPTHKLVVENDYNEILEIINFAQKNNLL